MFFRGVTRFPFSGLGTDAVETAEVLLERAVGLDELEVRSVLLGDRTLLEVVGTREVGESPLLRDDDLLASRELFFFFFEKRVQFPFRRLDEMARETNLVLGTTEGLHDDGLVRVLATDREDDLANVDTSDATDGVTPRTTHTRRQSIGTGARERLVGTDDVVGVGADAQVERVLARRLDDVLVGADTRRLERLRRDLLVLVRDQVDAFNTKQPDELFRELREREKKLTRRGTRLLRPSSFPVDMHAIHVRYTREMGARETEGRGVRDRRFGSWHRGHHGCTYSWGRACSCSSGSNERVGVLHRDDKGEELVSGFNGRQDREEATSRLTHCSDCEVE